MNRGPGTGLVAAATLVGLAVVIFLKERAAAKVERVELPGFSIELPAGTATETSKSPMGGSHKVDLKASPVGALTRREVSNPSLVIQWMAQEATQQEWRDVYLPIFSKSVGAATGGSPRMLKEETIDDQRWLYIVGDKDIPIGFGVVSCDVNFQVLVMFGRYRDADRQAEALGKILRSAQCSISEANRTRLTAALRLPDRFGRTSNTDFEGYKSLDGEVVMINFTNGDVLRDRKVYKTIATSLLSAGLGVEIDDSQLKYLPDPKLSRPASLIRGDLTASNETIYVGTQFCDEHNQTLMFMWIPPDASDEVARERLSQVGCPGDESRELRKFSDVAADACAAGERSACDLSDFID